MAASRANRGRVIGRASGDKIAMAAPTTTVIITVISRGIQQARLPKALRRPGKSRGVEVSHARVSHCVPIVTRLLTNALINFYTENRPLHRTINRLNHDRPVLQLSQHSRATFRLIYGRP